MMPVHDFPKPGETVLCDKEYISRPGGKGANQAIGAAKMGVRTAIVGQVGDDSFGRRSVKNLKAQGIWSSGVGISDRPTGCSTIAVNHNGDNFVITAPGANLDTSEDQVPNEILSDKNILLVQLEIRPEETFAVLKRAKANGATTIINPSPARNIMKENLKNIDYLIVNEIESLQLAKNFKIENTEPMNLAKAIAELGNLTCIITLEERGAVAAKKDVIYTIPTLKVDVVDSTGAGDCFCGIFAARLHSGDDWLKALHYASIGASLSCLGLGAQRSMPNLEDIEARLSVLEPPQKVD